MLALLGIIPTIASLLKAFFGMKTTQATAAANQEINQINAQAGVQESEGHYADQCDHAGALRGPLRPLLLEGHPRGQAARLGRH
jgi:hypothetical protein